MKTLEAKKAHNPSKAKESFFKKDNASLFSIDNRNLFFSSGKIQPKLKVEATDDPQEKEADRMADQVVHRCPTCENEGKADIKNLNTKSDQIPIRRKCSECEKKEKLQRAAQKDEPDEIIHRKEQNTPGSTYNLVQHLSDSKGSGQKMETGVQKDMNSGFGHDFSNVRIHTDSRASEMNQSIHAKAFTHNQDIYFNQGQYNPNSKEGRHLLAHELTHTVQQKSNSQSTIQRVPQEILNKASTDSQSYFDDAEKFKKLGQNSDASYSIRVALLLTGSDKKGISTMDEYDDFKDDKLEEALDEDKTLKEFLDGGKFVLYHHADAFPNTWSKKIYDALYIPVDIPELTKTTDASWKDLEDVGKRVPKEIMDTGLPVDFTEALKLSSFDIEWRMASFDKHNICVEFAQSGRKVALQKWILSFYVIWNGIVEQVRDNVHSGDLVINTNDYDEYMSKKKKSMDELGAFISTTNDEKSLMKVDQQMFDLRKISFLTGFASLLGSIAVTMFFWAKVKELFAEKLKEADAEIKGKDHFDKVVLALKWAYENGYFGAAGAKLWQAIKDNWFEILRDIVIFIILQFIPVVDVIVDVVVVIMSGVGALKSLYALTNAFLEVDKVQNTVQMQNQAALLAQSITIDGVMLIIDLIGFVSGVKGVKAKIAKLKFENPGMSDLEIMEKATKDADVDPKVAKTIKKALTKEEGMEITQKLGEVSEDTIKDLMENPELKNALFDNPDAAWLLKKCASSCFPKGATKAQVKRLQKLIEEAELADSKIDRTKLKKFLYERRKKLDDAIDAFEDHVKKMQKAYFDKLKGISDDTPEPDMRFDTPESTKVTRGGSGFGSASIKLPKLGKNWLDRGISQIPGQIAEKMSKMHFANWDDFREVFWKLVADDPELSQSPYLTAKQNPKRISEGLAPFTRSGDAMGKGSNAKYQLDHITPIEIGGDVFDLGEIYIITPKSHAAMAIP